MQQTANTSARGFRLQRHVDSLLTEPKHFAPEHKRMAKISTGVNVEYVLHEQQQPGATKEERVVLIRGFQEVKEVWTPTVDQLLRQWPADSNLKILTFDNRGAGRSDATWGRYTTSQLAADALALMDHLEWQDAHIVGYSMGGMISLELASAAPERVKSLSLLATTRGKYTSDKDDGTALRMLFTRDPAALAEFMVGILYPETFKSRKMDDSDEIVHHQLIAFHRHRFENAAPSRFIGWIGQLLALVTHYVSHERLATIAQAGFPVLIIGCGDDDLIPGRESATLATHIKGTHVKYISYDDAGHGVTVQYMDEVTEELLATFRRAST
ncbi:hypothetical protein Poli38472_003320 [Pythium oligandrum]|uniref:AB hydrolase-1 domain-containing protein n=1 Tax=Pythium oligandrum TaxID=41045 RepID=A0A8K1C6U6_PYTOL|nr:hypothetical protein Poli38472_003320 [Pythium oligandrum]|eukprot:TMW57395.1 hypothetical protein Poli38472_003320 [Pythium oligandrum]